MKASDLTQGLAMYLTKFCHMPLSSQQWNIIITYKNYVTRMLEVILQ